MTAAGDGLRRVLVLAYFFPPLGGAGVQRMLKFAKYLPASGWAPTVVTTRSTWYPAKDPSLLADLPPQARVLRAADPGALRLLARAGSLAGPAGAVLGWPDEAAAWIPGAVRQAVRAARREGAEAILSSSAPLSSHLAALAVQRATGLPWVADFRDEWADNPFAHRPRPVDAVTRRAEVAVRERAARVTVAAGHYRIGGHGPEDPKRVTIANGVDPDDVGDLAPTPRNARFRLVFTGTLYAAVDCRPVFEALARLAARGAIDPGRVEFRLVGNVWIQDVPSAGPVHVERVGYVEHARALEEMAAADVLVAHVDPASANTPAKVYEYLATGRPVLCVTRPDSIAHGLVRELNGGWAVGPENGDAVEAALLEAYERWSAGALESSPAVREGVLRRHGRDVLTRSLADVLDEVTAG